MVRAGLLRTLAPSAAHCTQAPTIKELLAERAVKAALSRACEVDDDTQLSRTLFGGPWARALLSMRSSRHRLAHEHR